MVLWETDNILYYFIQHKDFTLHSLPQSLSILQGFRMMTASYLPLSCSLGAEVKVCWVVRFSPEVKWTDPARLLQCKCEKTAVDVDAGGEVSSTYALWLPHGFGH